MDAPKHATPEEELAWLRNFQAEAEGAGEPSETPAPLTQRQEEAAAADRADEFGRQKRVVEERRVTEARTRNLVARFRAETVEPPADPPQAPPPRPWWARWR